MSWVVALVIVVAVYLVANLVVRRLGLFSATVSADTLRELISRREERAMLLDVRTAAEYRAGHIPSAVNVPHDSIAARPPKCAKDEVIVLCGRTGSHSLAARRSLKRLGFTNVVNFGAVRRWKGELVEGFEPGPSPAPLRRSASTGEEPESDER